MSAPLAPEAARKIVLGEVVPAASEPVPLEECLGRATTAEVKSAIPIQPFDNSAMDGYALRSADAQGTQPRLRLVGESRAGCPAEIPVSPGEAIWISTGAMVPAGADAVLPVEDATEEDDHLLPGRPVASGENIRRAGEDVEAGQTLISPGQRIGAAEVAVLAAAGVAQVECALRPQVAILGSGDELVPPGQQLGPGQIHDSNSCALTALVHEAGGEVKGVTHLPDEATATRAALADSLDCDALIVAGGVSVGRHDHVKGALAELGVQERFWRVAMRPGGPTWFGVLLREDDRPVLVFGLPGNPVSAMVTFHLFTRPALLAMQDLDPLAARSLATLASPYRKQPGKAHYLRCRIELTDTGWRAHLTRESQGSHVLTSMLGANALAVIPADADKIAPGERIEIELLR